MRIFDEAKEKAVYFYEHVLRRSRHYKSLFLQDEKLKRSSEVVLADLRKFCFFDSTTGLKRHNTENSIDPLMMARNEGRREVYIRILRQLNTDENAIIKLIEGDE